MKRRKERSTMTDRRKKTKMILAAGFATGAVLALLFFVLLAWMVRG